MNRLPRLLRVVASRAAMGLVAVLVSLGSLPARAAAPATAATATDQELRAAAEAFAAAWNRVDSKGMAAAWAEDGDMVNPFGVDAKGRAALAALFEHERATTTKGTRFKITAFKARLVRPDLALEDIDVELSGGALAPDPAKPVSHHVFAVAQKQGGGWHWIALRAYRAAPPAPPPSK